MPAPPPSFVVKTLADLTIDDEASFRHVGLYADLKAVLTRDAVTFRVLPQSHAGRWDRALMLNLAFWSDGTSAARPQRGPHQAAEGGDILESDRIPADVVLHVAWHHLASRAFASAPGTKPSADALFMGEAIASAFDVYLVGRLLGHAPRSSFLETQVPAMADAATDAGASDDAFEALLTSVALDPDKAFDDLRALLYDASRALFRSNGAEDALRALASFDDHRFGAILHRYELANWVLYARAYAEAGGGSDPRVEEVDQALRKGNGLDGLSDRWGVTRAGP